MLIYPSYLNITVLGKYKLTDLYFPPSFCAFHLALTVAIEICKLKYAEICTLLRPIKLYILDFNAKREYRSVKTRIFAYFMQ